MPEEIRADLLLGRDTLSPGLVKAGRAASDASSNVSQLTRNLYELSKQRSTPVVDLNDKDATAKLEDVTAKLKELGAKAADPGIDVNDKEALAKVATMRVRLDELGRKVSSPRITLEGLAKAEAKLLTLDAQLDRLDGRKVTAEVEVKRRGGLLGKLGGLFGGGGLSSLFGAGSSAAGGASQGEGGLVSGFGQAAPFIQGGLIGSLALLAATLGPSLIPLGLGGLVGGGAAGGALVAGSKAEAQLLKLQTALQSAKGPNRRDIKEQIAALKKSEGPEIALSKAGQNVFGAGLGTFLAALSAPGAGNVRTGAAGPSFLTSLEGILKQIAGFIKTLGPQLAALFQASIPFLKTFVGFLEQAAKTLLPVFTQTLEEFVKSGALQVMAKGLMVVVQGFAGFLKALGPSGMRASARIFVVLMEGVAAVLVGLGHTMNFLAEKTPFFIDNLVKGFKQLGHLTASIFDAMRHDIAATWDAIFSNSLGRVIRGGHDIEREFNTWRHDIAAIFDALRHSTATVWDAIWTNTVGRTQRGVGDVVGWFKRLPGEVIHALFGLGHQLYAFAHAALNEMWSGFKAIGGSILSWVGNFVKSIWSKVKSFFGINSPSSLFYDIGKNLMLGLFHGIKDHAHTAATAARGARGAVSGALGGDAAANMRLARSMFPWPASMWPAFFNLEMREAGFNRFARNPSSGAYGIPQALPPTKLPFAGQAAGGSHAGAQLSWMFSYIAGRYGSPLAAWAHEQSAGWYDKGGWLPTGLSLALNTTGRPEPVGYGHGAGGSSVNNYITVQVGHGTHPVAAAQELVKLLNAGAKAGVRVRSSILGPG